MKFLRRDFQLPCVLAIYLKTDKITNKLGMKNYYFPNLGVYTGGVIIFLRQLD